MSEEKKKKGMTAEEFMKEAMVRKHAISTESRKLLDQRVEDMYNNKRINKDLYDRYICLTKEKIRNMGRGQD